MPPPPEVLAPAGDADALKAAVAAGADAVYFGVRGFNARARAANFAVAELPAIMASLRRHGVRGYVTLNTLVFDHELDAVEAVVIACREARVDAIIVQDFGVLRLARALAPGVAVHASTQMTCTDAASVAFAASLGASRVVLARELSLADIRAIAAETSVELEVFVHGALCIAYSGQCLTSEAIGGRSANRGACAQACRLPYELVVDGAVRDLGDRAFLLSPEDLEASALVPELAAAGVRALKIEGRLKGPEYVAAATTLYRRAVDALGAAPREAREEDVRSALQTYTRGSGTGFLEGVNHQRLVEGRSCDHRGLPVGRCGGVRRVRGRDLVSVQLDARVALGDGLLVEGAWGGRGEVGGRVWGLAVGGQDAAEAGPNVDALVWLGPDKDVREAMPGRRVFQSSDPANERAIAQRLRQEPHRVPIAVRIHGRFGEPFVLEAASPRGHAARVVGDVPVEVARTAITTREVLREKLEKLGDTPFVLGELTVELPEGAMLPASALNRARRALADALIASIESYRGVPISPPPAPIERARPNPPRASPPSPGLFVLCRTAPQAHAAVRAGADGVILDFLELTGTGEALRGLRATWPGLPVTLAPPRIRKPGEAKIDKYLHDLAPEAMLVRGLGALAEIRSGSRIAYVGDFSLNVTNRASAAEVLGRGLCAFTPSFDLDAAQLVTLCEAGFGPWAEVVVHHPMPLFHMEHCAIAALLSEGRDHKTCGRPCDRHDVRLRDRAGMDHPVQADVGCRNTVFHAVPQSAAGVVASLQKSGVGRFRIELVRETEAEVGTLVRLYRELLDGRTSPGTLRQALRADGGYGVVSGSLRVT
jgi:putative protease